jgi:hypothetical protein
MWNIPISLYGRIDAASLYKALHAVRVEAKLYFRERELKQSVLLLKGLGNI